jgi:hypothetical protein
MTDADKRTDRHTQSREDTSKLVRWLTIALAASIAGSSFTKFLVPVIAATLLNAQARDLAVLTALPALIAVALRLPAGRSADGTTHGFRYMLWLDYLRAVILLLIPILWVFRSLNIAVLMAIVSVMAIANVSYTALLGPSIPLIADGPHVGSLNARVSVIASAADITGPPVAGALLQVLAAPFVILVDVGSYLISAASQRRLVHADRFRAPTPSIRRGTVGTLRHRLRSDKVYKWLIFSVVAFSLLNGAGITLLILYATRTLGLSSTVYGIVLGAGAVGGVLAGMVAGRCIARYGLPTVMTLGVVLLGGSLAILPLSEFTPIGVIGLGAYEFLGGAGAVFLLISGHTYVQMTVQDGSLGTSLAFLTMCTEASVGLGALAGGVAASFTSVSGVVTCSGIGAVIMVPVCVFGLVDARGDSTEGEL